MRIHAVPVAHCLKCNTKLEPLGKIRPCSKAIEEDQRRYHIPCEVTELQVNGPRNLMCHACLEGCGGVNDFNKNQRQGGRTEQDGW
ncbi:hypothetical protein B0J15DRAFT_481785 [Fusarium solani]|uniref:Uncharacterized protein n=1 Tax=Fusarium solani TaxID=169388 RepID=A0A9P9L1E3_FUSSL|nr:uncharacterized protein B0J15DRAFT_481785 [Fusarium solani]KAH7272432.1 hypothetical protein B0J15DRAFT_481785 [Fusarium solani]